MMTSANICLLDARDPMNFNGFFFFLEKFAVVFNYKILTA